MLKATDFGLSVFIGEVENAIHTLLASPRREARSKLGFSPRGPEARLIHEGARLFTPLHALQASRLFTPQRFLNLTVAPQILKASLGDRYILRRDFLPRRLRA
ncbi:hypothetical protein DY000_02009751 [Brassica cretica]|uniref:Protein kinase domain-containing protein n=1 Tax=Brassica cretica TaxID=69181 RepID=A0ABQ7BXC7_BRACR|nr:hypothetical protein DY000_02009751 [Brassica cretica]